MSFSFDWRALGTERVLFCALTLLTLVPFWVVPEVPTTDGACHVYNAWVELHLHDPGQPRLARYFAVDPRPIPNWTAQAALLPLLAVFPPAVAEKVLVSGYVVLFLAAARSFAGAIDPSRRWLAFLALPFPLNWAFHFGFYSFCISLAFFLLVLGCWWRWRERPGPRLAAALTLLMLLCYFSHIVSAILALAGLGVLWLGTLPAAIRDGALRRHLLHLPILLPQAILPAWFVLTQPGERLASGAGLSELWGDLLGLQAVFTYSDRGLRLGLGLAFLVVVLATLRRRLRMERRVWRDEDAFLVLAAVLALVYFASPGGMSGGMLLKLRLTLYPWLVLLPWLDLPAPLPRRALIAGLAALALWDVWDVAAAYRQLASERREMLAVTAAIAPGSRVLPLVANVYPSVEGPALLTHAFDRVAVAKGLIDWGDYEAASGVFPNRFRRRGPAMWQVQREPETVDVEPFRDEIDYVYCWQMPADAAAARSLARSYRRVAASGGAELFARRDRIGSRPVMRTGR